jgi:hypothetical protein
MSNIADINTREETFFKIFGTFQRNQTEELYNNHLRQRNTERQLESQIMKVSNISNRSYNSNSDSNVNIRESKNQKSTNYPKRVKHTRIHNIP